MATKEKNPNFHAAAKTSRKNVGHRKYKLTDIRDALASAGTISGAASILGCARTTIYKYCEEHPELYDAVREARDELLDLAESGLMTNIAKRHPASIFFVLKTLGKDRGYVERTETTGKDGAPLDTEVKVTFVNAKNKDD